MSTDCRGRRGVGGGLRWAAVTAIALLVPAAAVNAHPSNPHPGASDALSPGVGAFSHTQNPRNGIEELGFHPLLGAGFNTDVWGHVTRDGRLFAYSGTWGTLEGFAKPGQACPSQTDNPLDPSRSGIKIVNVDNPAKPTLAAKLGSPNGAQNNDVKVARVNVNRFDGDLLAHSLEPCGAEGLAAQVLGPPVTNVPREQTGFQLYDVSDPVKPRKLGKWNNGGLGTHNHYIVPRPDVNRALVAAVYNEVGLTSDIRGVLQLVDVSNPNSPRLASDWELDDANIPCEARGTDSAMCYLHDVWASPDGKTLYLSYWDAGLILLDISDPDRPRFIGRGQQQLQDGDPQGWLNEEGNTHAAVPMNVGSKELVIVGDEDFTGGALSIKVRVNSPAGAAGDREAIQWQATVTDAGETLRGQTADLVYAGTGCTDLNYAGVDVRGKIALVDDQQGTNPADRCERYLFKQKVDAAERAGAIGFVQIDRDEELDPNRTAVDPEIPALEIKQSDGVPLRDRVVAGTAVNVTLGAPPIDPWGFMRVVDTTSGDQSAWREVSQFKAPHVDDGLQGPEDTFSAHNPIVGPDGRVYYAWYTDGVRVLEPEGATGSFREVAWFVPRPSDHPDDLDEDPHGAQEANVGFWGSYPICHPKTKDLLILNSDLNRGLYVLRLSGDSCRLRSQAPGVAPPRSSLTDSGLPVVRLVAPRLASDVSRDQRFPLHFASAAPDLDHYELQAFNSRERKWRTISSKLLTSEYRFAGYFGANYRLRARAVDSRGRAGPWSNARTIVPVDDRRGARPPKYRGRWSRPKARGAYLGRVSRSKRRGARMRHRFRGSRVYLVGRTSRRGGKALVILNGKRKRVNFYSAKTRDRHVVIELRANRRRVNTLQVVNLGKRSKRSRGTLVEIDGVGVRSP